MAWNEVWVESGVALLITVVPVKLRSVNIARPVIQGYAHVLVCNSGAESIIG